YYGGANTYSGGAGQDTYQLLWFPTTTGSAEVTDFTPGTGGDVVDFSWVLNNELSGYVGGTNPFTTGYARLFASGGNTLLQFDSDGSGTAHTWQTALTFDGVNSSQFRLDNFSPSYSPTGSGLLINGNSTSEVLNGSASNDTIFGNGGNDTIHAGSGDDSVDGGTGNDSLDAGVGNDTVLGGDDNDSLDGGSGDDCLDGGAGNDTFYDISGTNTFTGGDGSDLFRYVSNGAGGDILTGGTGSDTYQVVWQPGSAADEITDFAAGANGDVLDLGYVISELSNRSYSDNPFTDGHLQFITDGSSGSFLQVDLNGGANSWQTILHLD